VYYGAFDALLFEFEFAGEVPVWVHVTPAANKTGAFQSQCHHKIMCNVQMPENIAGRRAL
jgi:hypothetical protein